MRRHQKKGDREKTTIKTKTKAAERRETEKRREERRKHPSLPLEKIPFVLVKEKPREQTNKQRQRPRHQPTN